jgi:hypothetical protein
VQDEGFDAVEPDIDDSFVDVGADAIGFPVTYADQIAFNKMNLADDARARGTSRSRRRRRVRRQPTRSSSTTWKRMVDFAVEESACEAGRHVCGILQVSLHPATVGAVLHTEYLDEYAGASKVNYQPTLNTFIPSCQAAPDSGSILRTPAHRSTAGARPVREPRPARGSAQHQKAPTTPLRGYSHMP